MRYITAALCAMLLFACPALAQDGDSGDASGSAEATLQLLESLLGSPAAGTSSGKLYKDESFTDHDGKLHIVISQAAVMQFKQEWPRVGVPLNIVSMEVGSDGQRRTTTQHTSSGTAGQSAAPDGGMFDLTVPGLGTFNMLDPEFMGTMRGLRELAPQEFDSGFMQGYQQSLEGLPPEQRALMEQFMPMNDGISVPEAMGKIDNMLQLFNNRPRY